VLAFLFSTASAGAANAPSAPPARIGASAVTTAQVISASPARPPLADPRPTLVAAIIGDRQRMVQVALIFMGIAILILTRGNRF